MKLGLLGYPVSHSLSPKLYAKFLGDELTSYELFSYEKAGDVPPLEFFSKQLDGLNITSPYKTHFLNQITIESELVRKLGAVNTLAFMPDKVLGTNTDVIAVVEILKNYRQQFGEMAITLLGDGVMAKVTTIVAEDLQIPLKQFSRKKNADFSNMDLRYIHPENIQNIVINSCSRDFVFKGKLSGKEVFWDYNYSFMPHQNTLPSQVLAYHDGQEMLERQARAAIVFWKEVTAKLK